MDKLLAQLIEALETVHTTTSELQQQRANDPVFLPLHRHLWIVRHSINAARAAVVDVSVEASKLREKGVEL
jgi:hypothetical protein